MPQDDTGHEPFETFKKSFYYGSRSDLNFKFLANLADEEAAQFFQELLWKLSDSFDDGNLARLVEHAYEWQVRAYAKDGPWSYDEGPFVWPDKTVAESRLALVTTSGHFVEGDDPEPFGIKSMTQAEAARRIDDFVKTEAKLSIIPIDTPKEKLRVRHPGYDIRAAQTDPNVVFPLEILLKLRQEGKIGELAPDAYSFVGASSQLRLLKKTGPEWVRLLKSQQIDIALLVPV